MATKKGTTVKTVQDPTTIDEWSDLHGELVKRGDAHPNEVEHARRMSLGAHPDYKGGSNATGGSADDDGVGDAKKPKKNA